MMQGLDLQSNWRFVVSLGRENEEEEHDEHDDIPSPTPEQHHETSEDEVPADDYQEQTDNSDDAHDSEAPDDYGVYTDVSNQTFSTSTSLYSFYRDVTGESVHVFTEVPLGISKFGRAYRPSYVFNSPYMIPPFRRGKDVRPLPPPQIMDHAIDISTSVDINPLRGLENPSMYDEFD